MVLCIEPTIQSVGVTVTMSDSGAKAGVTPLVPDAYLTFSCPINLISSSFSLGGWDDELGWDDGLGWAD